MLANVTTSPIGLDELTVLKLVVDRLERTGVEYMLTGSLAMALYVQPRMTRDLDLVVAMSAHQAGELARLFEPDFLVDDASMRRAASARGMCNLIHSELLVKVNLVVRKDDVYRATEFARRRRTRVDGVEVWAVSAEDLILSKLLWMQAGGSVIQPNDPAAMNDSAPWAEAKMRELWALRTPGERVVAACGMFETAKALVAAGIRGREPGISAEELKLRIFEQMYRDDFTPTEWSSILERLRHRGRRAT